MKKLAFLFLTSSLGASSVEPWVAGTRPYETVPYRELNITLQGSRQGAFNQGGLRLDGGLMDHWMLSGYCLRNELGAPGTLGALSTQFRLSEEGRLPVDLGVYGEWRLNAADSGLNTQGWAGGAVLAKELQDNSLNANLELAEGGRFSGRFGYRSAYVWWTLRAGVELEFDGAGSPGYVPQLCLTLPGDIAFQLGARFLKDVNPDAWLISLSYEIFPSP